MSVIDELITDREEGSFYNASDLNRVGEAAAYLSDRLALIGIRREAPAMRTDWTAADIPSAGQMEAYLSAVAEIREAVRDYRPEAALPESMRFLDWEGANEIERLLSECETMIKRVLLSRRGYAGRVRSGGNGLP